MTKRGVILSFKISMNSEGEMTKKGVMLSLSKHGAVGIANYALAVMLVV